MLINKKTKTYLEIKIELGFKLLKSLLLFFILGIKILRIDINIALLSKTINK